MKNESFLFTRRITSRFKKGILYSYKGFNETNTLFKHKQFSFIDYFMYFILLKLNLPSTDSLTKQQLE
jgi:hypothetical protein